MLDENPVESDAMWKLYLKSDEGIAIQTTFKRLKDCFRNTDERVCIGKVRYFNPTEEALPDNNTLKQFLFKLQHYGPEKETRAVYQDLEALTSQRPIEALASQQRAPAHGVHIAIELETLIENIYLAPRTSEMLLGVVQAVVSKFGLPHTVKPSELDGTAVF